MATQWASESCDRYDDPVSGARIIQLTSAAAISNNIYCEQPYCSPDGKRVIIARSQDFCWDTEGSLLVHDLDTLRITMVAPRAMGVRNVCNSAWSGLLYYWTPDRKLMRINLVTLANDEIYHEQDANAPLSGDGGAATVSPDQRYMLSHARRMTGPDSPTFQIIRFDLEKKVREVIYEDPEICNAHLQFNPHNANEILVQNNRGVRMNKDGSMDYRHSDQGTTLFVIDKDGQNKRYLPVGQPLTASCTGHECFVGDSGKVMWSATWYSPDFYHMTHDERHPDGNIMTAMPGDEKPTVFKAPEHFFTHVCASRCGNYFVADSFEGGGIFDNTGHLRSASLVIGNFATGKYRTLVQNSMASGGGNQCTHAHAYLTADSRHVIFNADPYQSTPQVYAAKIPKDFLKSLD